MSGYFQATADRVEIGALQGEFTDAVMMRDYDRVASLFTPDGALRMPNVPVDLVAVSDGSKFVHRVPPCPSRQYDDVARRNVRWRAGLTVRRAVSSN